MKLTKRQRKIITEATMQKVCGSADKNGAGGLLLALPVAVAAMSAIAAQTSAAIQAGATFEDLLCLIYGIKGEEK